MRSEWYDWPRQRADALARLAWHDAMGHDTYVRMCLFTKDSGTKKNALPSRIIWRDDVIDQHTPCSILIETSEAKYQAVIKLDRPATTAEREQLMRAWRGAHADSDDCSADPVHFIRIVGGHNHKRHGAWLVRYAMRSERIYNTDRLLARCEGETHPLSDRVSRARAEQHTPDAWKQLPNGRRLLDSPRWQAIIKGRPQLRRLLVDHQHVTITNKNGAQDDSESAQRAVFVQNLITSWSERSPGHLPECEIRAVALTLKPILGSGKTMGAYQVDIDCLITTYRPKDYQPVATRRLGAKRERGRPAGQLGAQTIATLRAIEAIEPDAFGRRVLNLEAFDAPRRTVQYRLAMLRKAGLLITKQIGGNGPLYAILTPKAEGGAQVYSSADEAPNSAAEPPKTSPVVAAHGETEYKREGVFPPDRAVPLAPPPALADLVRDCFDAYTGARITLSRVVRYVEMNAGGRVHSRSAIALVTARERRRRGWARRDQREAEQARKLKWASLVKKSQAVASQAATMRRTGDKRAPIWERRAGILAAEETRRIEAGQAPSARLLPRRGVTAEQALLLAELDEVRKGVSVLERPAGSMAGAGKPNISELPPAASEAKPGAKPSSWSDEALRAADRQFVRTKERVL